MDPTLTDELDLNAFKYVIFGEHFFEFYLIHYDKTKSIYFRAK